MVVKVRGLEEYFPVQATHTEAGAGWQAGRGHQYSGPAVPGTTGSQPGSSL